MSFTIPAAYRTGYERARRSDPELAARCVEHTTAGDPAADAAIEALEGLPQRRIHALITAGMERDAAGLRPAPAALRELMELVGEEPGWFDSRAVYPGCRAFHADSDLYIEGLVGSSIIRGFSTLISLSFFETGRLLDHGVRRLRQNIRQLIEITIPGGLEREGEGWKLSVRIRLIHAQVRRQLRRSGRWDEAELGVPIHAAHLAFAAANFSAMVVQAATRLGAAPTPEQREAFVQIWRYSAHLMGVPETILFRNEVEALDLFRVGEICKPFPDWDGRAMAHALVNSAPVVIGVTDPVERHKLALHVYRISRALIGDERADRLGFPAQRTRGVLAYRRTQRRLGRWIRRPFPGWERRVRAQRFTDLVEHSQLRQRLETYTLPPKLHSDEIPRW